LHSTSASLWTLETVSGSSQVVLPGQAFQPLVMRVTDGSGAANPVLAVNVAFATTLARIGSDGGGIPVLLGSSQAQAVTDQNGVAFIVPSAGNVGPCDVFIAVSVGNSSAQLQMESLAAIVLPQPNKIPARAPAAQPIPRFAPNIGSQASAPASVPEVLFAMPEVISSDDSVVDSQVSARPESSADEASGERGVSEPSSSAGSENSASAPSVPSKRVEGKVSKRAAAPAGSGVAPTNAPASAEIQSNPVSSNWLPEDKRSCRALAADVPLP
jgi:hypothetical protein